MFAATLIALNLPANAMDYQAKVLQSSLEHLPECIKLDRQFLKLQDTQLYQIFDASFTEIHMSSSGGIIDLNRVNEVEFSNVDFYKCTSEYSIITIDKYQALTLDKLCSFDCFGKYDGIVKAINPLEDSKLNTTFSSFTCNTGYTYFMSFYGYEMQIDFKCKLISHERKFELFIII